MTLDTRNSLGDSSVEFAAALLSRYCETKANGEPVIEDDYSLAEIVLLNALLSLLHDWFPESDCTPDGLEDVAVHGVERRVGSEPPLTCCSISWKAERATLLKRS